MAQYCERKKSVTCKILTNKLNCFADKTHDSPENCRLNDKYFKNNHCEINPPPCRYFNRFNW